MFKIISHLDDIAGINELFAEMCKQCSHPFANIIGVSAVWLIYKW